MTTKETLEQRGSTYGDFASLADIEQMMKSILRFSPSWHKLQPFPESAIEMIVHKLARIVNGDPFYIENAHDIAGYAELMVRHLQDKEGATDSVTTKTIFQDGEWKIDKER